MIWSPTEQSVVGQNLDGKAIGVATSIWVTDAAGDPLVELFDRPGRGLERLTFWCFWFDPGFGEWIGGDILFYDGIRP